MTRALRFCDFGVSVDRQMHIEDLRGAVLADTAAMHPAAAPPDANQLASRLCHHNSPVDPVTERSTRKKGGLAAPPTLSWLSVFRETALLGNPVAVCGG